GAVEHAIIERDGHNGVRRVAAGKDAAVTREVVEESLIVVIGKGHFDCPRRKHNPGEGSENKCDLFSRSTKTLHHFAGKSRSISEECKVGVSPQGKFCSGRG